MKLGSTHVHVSAAVLLCQPRPRHTDGRTPRSKGNPEVEASDDDKPTRAAGWCLAGSAGGRSPAAAPRPKPTPVVEREIDEHGHRADACPEAP